MPNKNKIRKFLPAFLEHPIVYVVPSSWPRLGPVLDLTRHAQSARSNPVCGISHIRYFSGPRTGMPVMPCLTIRGSRGLKQGCPCPDRPRCAFIGRANMGHYGDACIGPAGILVQI